MRTMSGERRDQLTVQMSHRHGGQRRRRRRWRIGRGRTGRKSGRMKEREKERVGRDRKKMTERDTKARKNDKMEFCSPGRDRVSRDVKERGLWLCERIFTPQHNALEADGTRRDKGFLFLNASIASPFDNSSQRPLTRRRACRISMCALPNRLAVVCVGNLPFPPVPFLFSGYQHQYPTGPCSSRSVPGFSPALSLALQLMVYLSALLNKKKKDASPLFPLSIHSQFDPIEWFSRGRTTTGQRPQSPLLAQGKNCPVSWLPLFTKL